MKVEPCMCRAVGGTWEVDDEYPFVRQGVMHSPVGCIRREYSEWQLRDLYYGLTGNRHDYLSARGLFQALMSYLAQNPDIAERFPVTLVPIPTLTHVEKPPPPLRKTAPRTTVGVGSTLTNGGRYKPPWIK